MEWQALILAGSRGSSDPVAAHAGIAHKAFVPIAGKPMIEHVVQTLESAANIGDIAVSIEADALALPPSTTRLDAGSSPATSVLDALGKLDTPLLITTADNPLLRGETLAHFLEQSAKSEADILAAVSTREIVEKADKPGRRTYIKFSDHHVSGCNLFAVKTQRGRNAISFWRRLEQNRKKPWKMASEISYWALFKYLIGRLDSKQAVRGLEEKMGCKASLIFLDDPYAAHDVDKPEDLAFAERCLQHEKSQSS